MLVDINALPDLDHVTSDDGVRVGALARHAAVLADEDAAPRAAAARDWRSPASRTPTIRNRGTTVGSLAHADAAAEMPVVLRLLGGSLDVVGPAGRRTIAADDLFAGPMESRCAPGEIAVEAFFPALAPAPVSRSTRSPAGTATTRWSASPPSSRSTATRSPRRGRATSRSATCPPSST